jgi:hypothetical protein
VLNTAGSKIEAVYVSVGQGWRAVREELASPTSAGLLGAQQYSAVTGVKTSAYTAVRGDNVLTNSTGGVFNVTLPASPAAGDTVEIIDAYGTWSTNAVTALRNGSNINGAASDLTLNVSGRRVVFIYIDSTQGWRAY